MKDNSGADQPVAPVIDPYNQAKGGVVLERNRLCAGKYNSKQETWKEHQHLQAAKTLGMRLVQMVKV